MKIDPKKFAKMLVDFLRPLPTKVIHNNNHTIILFDDGSKTVTNPNGDKYDPYIGFCVAMTAKYFGSKKAAHEAYETLSGCKFHKQPEQVASFGVMVNRTITSIEHLTEAFRNSKELPNKEDLEEARKEILKYATVTGPTDFEMRTSLNKQTEQKAEPLQNSQSTDKYCHTCEYFNVSPNLEPCKSCRQIRTTDNRYPKWTAPKGKVPKPGKVILPEQDGLPFRRCRNCKHLGSPIYNDICFGCWFTKDHKNFEKKEGIANV